MDAWDAAVPGSSAVERAPYVCFRATPLTEDEYVLNPVESAPAGLVSGTTVSASSAAAPAVPHTARGRRFERMKLILGMAITSPCLATVVARPRELFPTFHTLGSAKRRGCPAWTLLNTFPRVAEQDFWGEQRSHTVTRKCMGGLSG